VQDRPTAAELVRAVKEHLEREVIPALTSPKLRYQTLVAAHVLSVLDREIEHGERAARVELAGLYALDGETRGVGAEPLTLAEVTLEVRRRTALLCAAIRSEGAGERADVRAHVRQVVAMKLAIANPAYVSLRLALTPNE
jgi:hypothetical protein